MYIALPYTISQLLSGSRQRRESLALRPCTPARRLAATPGERRTDRVPDLVRSLLPRADDARMSRLAAGRRAALDGCHESVDHPGDAVGDSVVSVCVRAALGLVDGLPSVALVALGAIVLPRRSTLLLAVACSGLTVLAFFFSPEGGAPAWIDLADRGLTLASLWVMLACGFAEPLAVL